jgi:hypothetical protein
MFDSTYIYGRDSTFLRWRWYPNPESTKDTLDSSKKCYTRNLTLSGNGKRMKFNLGLGYEIPIINNLSGFAGFKTLFGMDKDSSQIQGLGIVLEDTTIDTNKVFTYKVTKSQRFILSLPLGLEYKIISPVITRAGFNPKLFYEKWVSELNGRLSQILSTSE